MYIQIKKQFDQRNRQNRRWNLIWKESSMEIKEGEEWMKDKNKTFSFCGIRNWVPLDQTHSIESNRIT